MAGTTMTVTMIKYRPGKKRAYGPLDTIGEAGLLRLFYDYVSDLHPDALVDYEKNRYAHVEGVSLAGCAVCVEIEYGTFGNPGKTMSIRSHQAVHERGEDESATVHTRLVLVVPPGGAMGLFFIEREGNYGGGSTVMHRFRDALQESYPDAFYPMEALLEPDAWLKAADLLKFTVIKHGWSSGLNPGLGLQAQPLGAVETTFRPERGTQFLPRSIRDGLLDHSINAAEYLAVPDVDDDDGVEVEMTLQLGNVSRTFKVDHARTPSFRLQLTRDREPRLDPDVYVRTCFAEARSIYKRHQLSWNTDWETEAIVNDSVPPTWKHVDTPARWEQHNASDTGASH